MNGKCKGVLAFVALMIVLHGCGAPTKLDMMQKTQHIKSAAELQNVLGKPDKYDVSELPLVGRVETFTYKGSDGEMIFISHNGKIQSRMSDGDGRKQH